MTGNASFTYSSPINFLLPQAPPTSLSAAEQQAFSQVYVTLQQIINALISNCGIGPQANSLWPQLAGQPQTLIAGNLRRLYVTASETIQLGAAISLWNNAGVLSARNANATNNTKQCDGFCTTTGGIQAGKVGEVQLGACIANVSGLTVGQRYWLSTTNGVIAPAPATGAGNIEQYVGIAITTTTLWVQDLNYYVQH